MVSTFLCPVWWVTSESHDCWTAESSVYGSLWKKAERFGYGHERCVLPMYWEIMMLHSVVFFTDILRDFLSVLLSLLTAPRSFRRFDSDNCMVTGTLARPGILSDNAQCYLLCGITLKLVVVIREQAISHQEWNDESSACTALFCCVVFCYSSQYVVSRLAIEAML